MTYTLLHGDCLELLPTLAAQSVDCICADPPYGVTSCKWDSVIPLDAMWAELKRVIKPRGAIVLFASQPFTSALVMSNPRWFKYSWQWQKEQACNFTRMKFEPGRIIEDVLVFGEAAVNYNPQKIPRAKSIKVHSSYPKGSSKSTPLKYQETYTRILEDSFPTSLLYFQRDKTPDLRGLHPTQKPTALLSYLIRTYTNAGETVLDFCMGSGTAGVAALQEGRTFIGIEQEAGYFATAENRIANVQPLLFMLDAIPQAAAQQPALLEVA